MKTGLVLDGGGAKGAYQIGAWKYLYEQGIKFDAISGTSVGGLNAMLVAQNKIEDADRIWLELDKHGITKLNKEAILKLLKELFKISLAELISPSELGYLSKVILRGQRFTNTLGIVKKNGMIGTEPLISLLDKNVDYFNLPNSPNIYLTMVESFRKGILPKKFYENISKVDPYLKRDHLIATCAIPLLFSSGRMVDGGIPGFGDNSPIKPLIDEKCDRIYVIHLSPKVKEHTSNDPNMEIINITPSEDLGKLLDFKKNNIEKLIQLGYEDTRAQLA